MTATLDGFTTAAQRPSVASTVMPAPRRAGTLWTALNTVAAALILLLVLPVFLAVAVAVKLDGGPVFFRQTRVGRGGRQFRMVKFRSMVVDAEARLAALQTANEGAGPLFKLRRDPRITRVGAVLRKYSLDELPQLLNVLGGSMALVGPRPALQREVDRYCATARRRLEVKPGLTGLWQVSGRSDLSWADSIALDARYVDTWSPLLDLSILARTAGAVAKGGGAY
jgi:lipopolysaccharide/colanic/teichoic acid biosynthesis glycosyltransferase